MATHVRSRRGPALRGPGKYSTPGPDPRPTLRRIETNAGTMARRLQSLHDPSPLPSPPPRGGGGWWGGGGAGVLAETAPPLPATRSPAPSRRLAAALAPSGGARPRRLQALCAPDRSVLLPPQALSARPVGPQAGEPQASTGPAVPFTARVDPRERAAAGRALRSGGRAPSAPPDPPWRAPAAG